MKESRLFKILYILLTKKQTTASYLANTLKVSIRTIYRDIDTLCEAGIPIYCIVGKGGGIKLSDSYVFDTSVLSTKDKDTIIVAIQSMLSLLQSENRELLHKLSGLFNYNPTNWIQIDFTRWGQQKEDHNLFLFLRKSILQRKIISITYINTHNETSNRDIIPYKIHFKDKRLVCRRFLFPKESLTNF